MFIDGTDLGERTFTTRFLGRSLLLLCSSVPVTPPPTVWRPPVGSIHHMAATKKRGTTGATWEETTTTTPSQGEAAATQANGLAATAFPLRPSQMASLKSTFWTSASQPKTSLRCVALTLASKRHEGFSSRHWNQDRRSHK